jgi:6-phosphogluconolactonase (cycloisomerase 2 family)
VGHGRSFGSSILQSMTLEFNMSHGRINAIPAGMNALSHRKGRLMTRQIALWVRVVSAVLGLFLPVYGEAAMGALVQLSGIAGCVSEDGTKGACVDGRGLDGAGWVAVSPDGQHVYVASFGSLPGSSAVATFVRTSGTGALVQLSGPAGCVADIGDGVTCADGRGLDGAVTMVVSPDGKHVYVASRSGAVAAFARNVTTGGVTQLSGPAGCIDETGVTGCTLGKALGGARTITISPDGKHVYVGARDANAVAAFARDATTGGLTQLSGLTGCVSDNGTGGKCADGTGLLGARGMTVSRDGKHLYVASQDNNAVAISARDAVTGALTQLSGAAGCIAQNGDGVTCALGRGLLNPIHLEVSPDGQYVYVVSRDSNAVTIFARNVTTGVLTQLPGPAGCIAENGNGVTCAVGAGLREAVFLTMSPDGTNVYVASQVSDAVAIFTRNALTGALTQLPGVAGCVSEDGTDDGMAMVCADGKGLEGAIAVTVSPDGLNVYAAAYISKALTIFNRQ